jgi:hypothetical protein
MPYCHMHYGPFWPFMFPVSGLQFRALDAISHIGKPVGFFFWKSLPLHYANWLGLKITGSYVLYTHMMAQRRRVLRGKQRARD